MYLSRHFNLLMASAVSFSLAASPLAGLSIAHAQNAPAAEAPGDSGWQKEFELWRSASKAGGVSDYEAYLRAFPTGKFASVAKKRIDELNGDDVAQSSDIDTQKTADVAQADSKSKSTTADEADAEKKRDLEMWRQVSKTGTEADYEKYLKAFPKGKFAKVAKTRLESMTAKADAPAEQDVAELPADDASGADAPDDSAAQVTENVQPSEDAAAPSEDAAAPGNDWEQEYALWKAASNGNTIVEYEAYLGAYPKGKFAAIAQARIVQLAAAEQPVANIAEGDTTQNDQRVKPKDQASKQDQVDEGDPNQMDQADIDEKPADNRMTKNQADDPSAQDDMGQNTDERQPVQFTEGSPDFEDEALNREDRMELQGRLTSLGYDTRGADGSFGPNSRDAISGWQQDAGAPVNGYLSEDQVAEIRAASEQSYEEWLNAQPVVTERVRPRREKVVVVEERNPALDAAVAVGVLGAVVGAHKFGKRKFRPGKVKVIGKFKFGNCRKKLRC